MRKTLLSLSLGMAGLLFASFIGLWSKSLFTISESVHFSVNFPAGEQAPASEKMSCCDLGTPWERAFGSEWKDYPPGGVLVWGTEGQILIDVGQEGWLKRTLQPDFFNLSSHWIRNVGVKPYKIRLAMDLCDFDLEWDTFEADWDQGTLSSTRYIEPGKTFNMDWYFHIPPEAMQQNVVCQGKLEVFDALTDESLSVLPITMVNSRAQ
jgi:hypothetical protein